MSISPPSSDLACHTPFLEAHDPSIGEEILGGGRPATGSTARRPHIACFASSGDFTFSCDKYQPIIVADTLLYGFAGHSNTATSTCCKCCRLRVHMGVSCKSVIVQAINAGSITDSMDFDICVGAELPEPACERVIDRRSHSRRKRRRLQRLHGSIRHAIHQLGWSIQRSGSTSDVASSFADMLCRCARTQLPSSLQAGYYWRWQWYAQIFYVFSHANFYLRMKARR